MFIKSENNRAEIILGDNTKTQKDFNKLLQLAETKRKKINKNKCRFPHPSSNNQLYK